MCGSDRRSCDEWVAMSHTVSGRWRTAEIQRKESTDKANLYPIVQVSLDKIWLETKICVFQDVLVLVTCTMCGWFILCLYISSKFYRSLSYFHL